MKDVHILHPSAKILMATLNSIFDLPEYKPLRRRWETRQAELSKRLSYYDGSVYDSALSGLGWLTPRLAGAIKPLYLPCARAVNIDSGIVPGFWTFPDALSERFTAARDQVFSWSSWSIDGVLYVHYGALFGLSGLRIADLREASQVLIKPISPQCYMLLASGVYDAT